MSYIITNYAIAAVQKLPAINIKTIIIYFGLLNLAVDLTFTFYGGE